MLILLRIILSILIYFIGIILISLLPDNYDDSIIKIINKSYLYLLGYININYDVDKLIKYENYKKLNTKFIVIYNHVNFMDGMVLWSIFGKLGMIVDDMVVKNAPYCEYLSTQKLGCILINKKTKNTTDTIIKHINETNNILGMAPDAMKYPTYPNNIGDFKTGAFVGKFPILPVIIKYKNCDVFPDYKYEIKESIYHAYFKQYLNTNVTVDVNIMDMIYPKEEWNVDEYKDFVKNKMEIEYKNT